MPLGLVAAVYLDVTRSRPARFFRTVVEAMTALPSILAGLFIYAAWILAFGFGRSGLAAALALSVMMLPYIIRAADLALRLVPSNLREASAALGAPGWRGEMQVVLPTARSGLATAVILGIARAIGEASPVLLTAGFTSYMNANPLHGPMVSLPLETLKLVQAGVPAYTTRAFGCASFLLLVVIVLFAVARKIGGWGPGHLSPRGTRRVLAASAKDVDRFTERHAAPLDRQVPPGPGPASRSWRQPDERPSVDRPSRRAHPDRGPLGGRGPVGRRRGGRHGRRPEHVWCSPASRPAPPAYVPVSGEGSSWSANALNQWIADVQPDGMRVNYTANGSTTGRQDFIKGLTDFAASDIPFQTNPTDGSAPEDPQAGSYAYMPITAGGTVFMYNLKIDGQQVTNLRLSGENITKIFTGAITNWDDPALAADNPGLKLPDQSIVPVVRSDGAGSSYELSEWMISQYPSLWNSFCSASGRAPACGPTSFYPDAHRHDRPVRRPRRGRLRVPELRRRLDRLRQVLLQQLRRCCLVVAA